MSASTVDILVALAQFRSVDGGLITVFLRFSLPGDATDAMTQYKE